MKNNKEIVFSSSAIEMARFSKSLSHPARIMIVQVLSKHKDRTCKELVAELPLSQASVSQHLKALLEIGLICRKKFGAQSLYCIEWNALERIFTLFGRFNSKTLPNRPKRNCC